jgi:hypothetical protein
MVPYVRYAQGIGMGCLCCTFELQQMRANCSLSCLKALKVAILTIQINVASIGMAKAVDIVSFIFDRVHVNLSSISGIVQQRTAGVPVWLNVKQYPSNGRILFGLRVESLYTIPMPLYCRRS